MGTTGGLHGEPLSAGDQIGIDLGPQPTANWNNITSNNAGVAAGDVVNLAGVVIDDVAISTSHSQFTNNDGTNNWPGLTTEGGSAPAEFVDSVVTDISGNFNLGDEFPYTVTVEGLSASFSYDLVAVTTAGYTRIDTITVNGGEPSPISRPSSRTGAFHSFTGLNLNESGQLVIEVTDTAATVNPIINGILITATSDNLSQEPVVKIASNTSTPGTLDFEWNSQAGKFYDLLSSTDLTLPVTDWAVFDDGVAAYADLTAAGDNVVLSNVPSGGERRFFAVREKNAPGNP